MSASLVLWQKQMKKSLVHSEEIVGTLIQPILWVVLFGVGMRSLMGAVGPGEGDGYMTFVLPGIVALTVVGGAIGGGSAWLNERLMGIVKEYLVAPIPRLSILMGNALSITTKVLIQSIIIMLVGVLMGAEIKREPIGLAGWFLAYCGVWHWFFWYRAGRCFQNGQLRRVSHDDLHVATAAACSGATHCTRWQRCQPGCGWEPCSTPPPMS